MDIHVEMYRLERKFGWAVIVWRRGMDDKRHILHYDADGTQSWDPVDSNVLAEPPQWTYYFDDETLNEISRLWIKENPLPAPEPRLPDVLMAAVRDARQNRDDMVALLREVHQLAVRPSMIVPGSTTEQLRSSE